MPKPATNGDLIKTAERRAYILGLRKAGASYRDIARATIVKFGADKLPKGFDCLYAYKDVKRELEKIRDDMAHDTDEIRAIELERLDTMLMTVWGLATAQPVKDPDTGQVIHSTSDDTKFKAVDRVLKIMDRRLKLVPDLQIVTPVDITTGGLPVMPPIREVVANHPEPEEDDQPTPPTLEG